MAIYNIVQVGDEVLRSPNMEVKRFDQRLHTLLDDMAATMYQAEGVGLAAPQIGINKRVVVIDVAEGGGIIELMNPVIVEKKGSQTGEEGCLSLVGQQGIVTRANWVKVKAQNRFGEFFEIEGEGFLARAFQHEIDHTNGILFVDKANRMLKPDKQPRREKGFLKGDK